MGEDQVRNEREQGSHWEKRTDPSLARRRVWKVVWTCKEERKRSY
jgi:hypothetical protein